MPVKNPPTRARKALDRKPVCGVVVKYRIPKVKVRLVRDGVGIPANESAVAADVLRHICCDRNAQETLAVLHLDARSRIMSAEIVSIGAAGGVAFEPSVVFRGAILACARGIILGHNHPSGDPHPSREDIEMTVRMEYLAKQLGIALVDHIIVTDEGKHTSLLELGIIGGKL